MHLADGTITNDVCTLTAVLATVAVGYAARRAYATATPARLVKAAVGSGIVFLAQMWDVPLFGDVGVHLLGAAFLTLLAGPALALSGMTAVVVTQALALHDGGITALGANVLNMAVVGVCVAALALRTVRGRVGGSAGLAMAAALAGAASVLAATTAMTLELAASGTPALAAFGLTMPAHASFAAWETLTTLVLVAAAVRLRAVEPAAAVSVSG